MDDLLERAIRFANNERGRSIEGANEFIEESGCAEDYFGVETIEAAGKSCSYINTGDTYRTTILKPDGEELQIGTWGDWVEGVERQHCEENHVYKCPQCGSFHDKGLAADGWDSDGRHCPDHPSPIRYCDAFTKSYIECALWSTHDPSDDSDCPVTLDSAGWGLDDIPYPLHVKMVEDCSQFQRDNAYLLSQRGNDVQHGHDFWLTREGHGAGFWDRGYGEVGDKLTEAAKAWGNGSDEFYNYDWSTDS